MDTIDYLRRGPDTNRMISLDDKTIDMAFRIIAENIDDVLTFDGIDLAKIIEKGKVFG